MKVLIAEDDPVSRRVLEANLKLWDFEVITTSDGDEAWSILQSPDSPRLAVLDWMMPGLDGPTICRNVRNLPDGQSYYLLLLTAKMQKLDIVAGLQAGADDYVTKPFHREELHARVRVGQRLIEMQQTLATRVTELESAISQVKMLSGLLPICSYCKRIREGDDYWQAVEGYLAAHSEAQFSHGVCPDCYEKHVKPELERF